MLPTCKICPKLWQRRALIPIIAHLNNIRRGERTRDREREQKKRGNEIHTKATWNRSMWLRNLKIVVRMWHVSKKVH